MKSKLLFEREDGYREYRYKDQKIWHMDGYYMPEHWSWTKKYSTIEQIEEAIDNRYSTIEQIQEAIDKTYSSLEQIEKAIDNTYSSLEKIEKAIDNT